MIERLVSQNMDGSVCGLLAGNVEALSLLDQADGWQCSAKLRKHIYCEGSRSRKSSWLSTARSFLYFLEFTLSLKP
jgi:hypothetical protein